MIIPVVTAFVWLLYGKINGVYLYNIEPMYPGIAVSGIMCYLNKKSIS